MRKFALITSVIIFVVVASSAFADEEKKDWTLNTTISFWSEYVSTNGAMMSSNPSFQPELTLLHKRV
jgi:dolichyl-phosphate-mannose--protein O-mannosyl transferase